MTAAERRSIGEDIEALRREVREQLAAINKRLDALERPKIAKVIVDPWSQSGAGGAP